MPTSKPLYVCEACGWECYHPATVKYHQTGTCKRMRQLVNLMGRREQQGLTDHTGLHVGSLTLEGRITSSTPEPPPCWE